MAHGVTQGVDSVLHFLLICDFKCLPRAASGIQCVCFRAATKANLHCQLFSLILCLLLSVPAEDELKDKFKKSEHVAFYRYAGRSVSHL